jgi:hypothetical protein
MAKTTRKLMAAAVGWQATGGNRETMAATDAGNAVRDEVRKAGR